MPPWGLPGSQGQYGTMAVASNMVPAVHSELTESQSHILQPTHSSSTKSVTHSASFEIPDIVQWFCYLDKDDRRNQDGIIFSPYGINLKAKGFIRLSQLTLEFFKLSDLQDWLGIEVGTAILIMQYAKEDLDAIKSGRWTFPKSI
jgi:hypothetical protein